MSNKYLHLGGFGIAGRLFDHVINTETDDTFIRGLNEDGTLLVFLGKVNKDAKAFEFIDRLCVEIGKFKLVGKDYHWEYEPKDKSDVDFFKDLTSTDLLKLERLVFERILTRKLTKIETPPKLVSMTIETDDLTTHHDGDGRHIDKVKDQS